MINHDNFLFYINYSTFHKHSKMQKHQEWLDNKTYEHHLNCLIRIKQSKRK